MILIAEDHPDTRRALVRLLEVCGYDAIGVTSGAETMLFLQNHRPDLIILDWMMPGMTGLDALALIRQDARLASVPVIMYSALSRDPYEARALAAGAQKYLMKGGSFSEFLATVEQYAGRGKQPQQV